MEEICHGFVLKTVPYGDSGLVAKILTDTQGAASFMVSGAKRKGKSSKAGLFAPMNHVAIAFVRKENRDLYTTRHVSMHHMYPSLHTDIRKPAVAVYVAEALYRAVSERHHEDELYQFADRQMEKLDQSQHLQHFAQEFLVGLIDIFGFSPHGKYTPQTPDFLLNESTFMPAFSGEPAFSVRDEAAKYLSDLFAHQEPLHPYSRETRRETRRRLEDYLKLHLDGRFTLLSGEVLETVFDE